MPQRTLYYFAIGGTGALSVEPLIHLCAAGAGPERLSVIVIDPDAGNPAVGRALELIERYTRVRKAFGNPATGFFRTELIRTARKDSVWSPLGNGEGQATGDYTLEAYVQRARMAGDASDAATLFDLLFSPAQQREKLKEGFRGNPAIGSILMHALKDATLFKELMNSAKNDADARFFAVGSIFGGTGAAALPVIAKLLADSGIDNSRIGAALVTPYYSLGVASTDEARDGRLKPDSDKFMSATAAALPTYVNGNTRFGAMYVMGDDQSLPKPRKQYSAGGPTQVNDPHFVELFASLAAVDFAASEAKGMLYSTLGGTEPTWSDLTVSEETRRDLRTFFIAASFFLQYFGTHRGSADEQRLAEELRKMPWREDIGLDPNFVRQHAQDLNLLGEYFHEVWGWLWAVSHNYRALRLVSFDSLSDVPLRLPGSYASQEDESARLPIVEHSLSGFNGKARGGLFKRGDPDMLDGLVEMFKYYNQLGRQDTHGLAGLLHYLRVGTSAFVGSWYSAAKAGGN